MGKDKTKEKERHRTIRRNKKERLTKLEMLETYLEKYHSNILEEFEKFCENSKIVTSTTPAEKPPPLQDSVKVQGWFNHNNRIVARAKMLTCNCPHHTTCCKIWNGTIYYVTTRCRSQPISI